MFAEDLLKPANCKVPGASKVYDELLAFVQQTYGDKTLDTRAIIFALAYAKYSQTKKFNLNDSYNPHPKTDQEIRDNKTALTTIIKTLSNRNEYVENCKGALTTFEELRTDLYREVNTTLIRALRNRSLNIFSTEFLLEGPRYAFLLIYSSFILLGIATGLRVLAPKAIDTAINHIEDVLNPLRDHTSR